MESKTIQIKNFSLRYYSVNTLIIGSGAASLNAAVSLWSMGQKDILLATAKWGAGTSNNAGSDKQTYYKLSLSGEEPDSARLMAQDLFSGRCMHGDIALCEAQGSVKAFMQLIELGVPFPHDKYGTYIGYKTDHDPRARGTSAGPWTSRIIVSVLSGEVKRKKIQVLDYHQVIALLTDSKRSRVIGALAIRTREKSVAKAFVLFNATNIILGTGGPGDLYKDSVYPASQTGSTGMAFRAGVTAQNLTESQFGIASLEFRWNLSGSYQQVMPRYFSTDNNGGGEDEFLNGFFPDYRSLSKAVFLKGYQWPFDPAKIHNYGSSLIDILVFREREEKKRRVFIDFTRNISWNGDDSFDQSRLDQVVADYLSGSDALGNTPFERLTVMNPKAVELFSENGIDLSGRPVEIGICAQHNNGGLEGNIWWESDLKHLFPVGEVNGTHGVYRPGGSALNSGQVGSYRAAKYISGRYQEDPPGENKFLRQVSAQTGLIFRLVDDIISREDQGLNRKVLSAIRERMTRNGGVLRERGKVAKAVGEAQLLLNNYINMAGASSVIKLAECFRIYDNCISHLLYLTAIKTYIENGGRSRGSFIVTGHNTADDTGSFFTSMNNIELCKYDREVEKKIMETSYRNGKVRHKLIKVREIPEQEIWFERVWREYNEDNLFGS